MNEKITGAFIASLRKERAMTQKQLAEKLNVTDKAVSKWETGRGYPDIDSLMALSSCFGVSVNELMTGERLCSDKKKKEAQKSIAAELINEKQRRRRTCWTFAAIAVLTALFIISQLFGVKKSIGNITSYFQRDSVCHISADYSSLEICGVTYARMARMADEERDVIWEEDKLLCDRPMVGTRLSELDKIYSVKFCDNYDFVCLKQDSLYEDAIYCKADQIDEYRKNENNSKLVYCIGEYDDKQMKMKYTDLSDTFTQAVGNLTKDNCYNSWSPEGDSLDIYSHSENSPLLRFYGYLGEENGRFFITFSGDIALTENQDSQQSKDLTYRLNENVYEELSGFLPTENR